MSSESNPMPQLAGVMFAPRSTARSLSIRDVAVALIAGLVGGLVIAGPVGGSHATPVSDARPTSIRLDPLQARVVETSTVLAVAGGLEGNASDVRISVTSGHRTLADVSAPVVAGHFRADLRIDLPPGGLPVDVLVGTIIGTGTASLATSIILPGPPGSGEWVDPATGRTMRPSAPSGPSR